MLEEKERLLQKRIDKVLSLEGPKTNGRKNKLDIYKRSLSRDQLEALNKYYIAVKLNKRPSKKFCRSIATQLNVLLYVHKFGLFFQKPYLEAKEEDIDNYLIYLENNNVALNTINNTISELKTFYKWLHFSEGLIGKEEVPKLVEMLKLKPVRVKGLDSDSILSPKDIKKLILACDNSRDRALISLLFDSQARCGELLDCCIKDLDFDENGAVITLNGKTGRRRLRLVNSVPYLKEWINNHPYKQENTKPLFISFKYDNYGGRFTECGINFMLKKIGKLAKVKKPLHPHWFRHSGLDWLGRVGFNERDLRLRAGWTKTSNMVHLYQHYQEEEVNDKFLQINGVKKASGQFDKLKEELSPIVCPRCSKENPADAKYCNCGMILDVREIRKFEEFKKEADEFSNKLLVTPVSADVDVSKGMMEALFQTMERSPLVLERFKQIIERYIVKDHNNVYKKINYYLKK